MPPIQQEPEQAEVAESSLGENNENSPFGGGESAFGAEIDQGSSDFAAAVDTAPMPIAESSTPSDPATEDDGSRILGMPAVATLQGHDEIVTRALIASDMETAVEACFATGIGCGGCMCFEHFGQATVQTPL